MKYLLAVIGRRIICLKLRVARWVEKETTDQVDRHMLLYHWTTSSFYQPSSNQSSPRGGSSYTARHSCFCSNENLPRHHLH
ncbi:hypothetical protein Scep_021432 [Stephania cephalantha]|uniref:Uncharacterized protein n=1 Tax=Stephania cephalantha TaxID=152367 RepID=A0AAP0FB44_9MAGN